MALSQAAFLERLIESKVMSADAVRAFLDTHSVADQPSDGESLAKLLIREGRLTKYQATRIYQGESLVLGNYVILDKLGEGGMGMVFKARHSRMDRVVALKVLSPRVMKDPRALERFLREVKAAARLSHPNVVAAYDADEVPGTHFLVMQFVDGADLARLVKEQGPVSVEQVVSLLMGAANGLAYAHDLGIVHRDIKPQNLLLARDGTVKILDLGLARMNDSAPGMAATDGLTETGTLMGTVDFLAPEQALDAKRADRRSDIYSLGCTLYYLMTARPVYEADTVMKKLLAHRESPVPSLREVRPDVSERLEELFQRMVAKSPEDRPQSMTDVLQTLAVCESSGALATNGAAAIPVRTEPLARTGEWKPSEQDSLSWASAKPRKAEPETIDHLPAPAESTLHSGGRRKPQPQSRSNRLWLFGVGALVLAGGVVVAVMLPPTKQPNTSAKSPKEEVAAKELPSPPRPKKVGATDDPPPPDKKTPPIKPNGKGLPQPLELVRELKGHTSPIWAVDMTPNGERAITAGGGTYRDGKYLWTKDNEPDGTDYSVRVWNPQTGDELHCLKGHTNVVRHVVFSADGFLAASASWDNTVRIWDVVKGKELHTLEGHTKPLVGVGFFPKGDKVASVGYDESLRIWDVKTGDQLKCHLPQLGRLHTVVVSHDGRHGYCCSNKTVHVIDLDTGKVVREMQPGPVAYPYMSVSPDESYIAAGGPKPPATLWNLKTGVTIRTFEGKILRFSTDGTRLLVGCQEGVVKLLDTSNWETLYEVNAYTDTVSAFGMTSDCRQILTGSPVDGTLKLWKVPAAEGSK